MDDTELDEAWAALRARACDGKKQWTTARSARAHAARIRAEDGNDREAYPCRFCDFWHTGHPMTLATMTETAAMLRARAGHAPTEPGTGTTRRRRRKAQA